MKSCLPDAVFGKLIEKCVPESVRFFIISKNTGVEIHDILKKSPDIMRGM